MSENLEIQPNNGSHYVLRGGLPIARFNLLEAAEAFVLAELLEKLTPAPQRSCSAASANSSPAEAASLARKLAR